MNTSEHVEQWDNTELELKLEVVEFEIELGKIEIISSSLWSFGVLVVVVQKADWFFADCSAIIIGFDDKLDAKLDRTPDGKVDS